jgi:hypothetical protein
MMAREFEIEGDKDDGCIGKFEPLPNQYPGVA